MEQQELIEKIKRLPQDRVAEVEEFVDSLVRREQSLNRTNLHQALTDYAIQHAGTGADFDPDLETAATTRLRKMKRGEVYWADLVPRSASEQQGRRPVIVISHDAFNQTARLAIDHRCPAFNFRNASRAGASAVLLPQGTAALGKDSVALCPQVTTLDCSKLTQRIGELNSMELRQVEDGLKAAMDLH